MLSNLVKWPARLCATDNFIMTVSLAGSMPFHHSLHLTSTYHTGDFGIRLEAFQE